MTCKSCGRQPENGQATHWLGCPEILRVHAQNLVEPDFTGSLDNKAQEITKPEGICDHALCAQPKKEWSGKGAKPKYCATGHKKEK